MPGKTKENDTADQHVSDRYCNFGVWNHDEHQERSSVSLRLFRCPMRWHRSGDLRRERRCLPPYLIFILLQIILLKGKFPPFQLLQIAASYLTSAFITIFDGILPSPDQLGMRLALLVLAIILTGIGAAITVDVNIVPNPADGLARVLGEKCGKNMGFGKNLFDFSAIVISIVIGMIGAGHIVGIGIGTVVAMICTGRVIAVFNHFLKKKIEMSVM